MPNNPQSPIPVVVSGALGRMGSQVIKALQGQPDLKLVGAIDTSPDKQGKDIGEAVGLQKLDIAVTSDFEASLCLASQEAKNVDSDFPAVLVDFTHPSAAYEHTRSAIAYGVHPVIGTTGISLKELDELSLFAEKSSIGAAVIPNFSVGMVLLQQAAAAASRFYENAELTELHHNNKADAPSGTCIKTAELMEELGKNFNKSDLNEIETLPGSRGGLRDSGLRIHSIRLPGLVAHQEVIFGSPGETYTLRHDTIDRSAYMPGVLMVIRKVTKLRNLVYGLERIL